uniref:Uncharacterized protein n=1 Tax=Acrobeloides nanus TaxID=290746 RepID=A0A914E095_9BILA
MEERFPIQFIEEVSKVIHHSVKDEDELQNELSSMLRSRFFMGENVELLSQNESDDLKTGTILCVANKNSPSNKENPPSYNVKITDELIRKDVQLSKLRRCIPITDADIKNLINTMASRISKAAPWKLNDEYRQKFEIKDKVFPLFATKSPKISSPTVINSRTPSTTHPNVLKTHVKRVEMIDEIVKKVSEVIAGPIPSIEEIKKKRTPQALTISSDEDDVQLIQDTSKSIKKEKSKRKSLENGKQKASKSKIDKPSKDKTKKDQHSESKKRKNSSPQGEPKKKKAKKEQDQEAIKKRKLSAVVKKVAEETLGKDLKKKKNLQKTLNSFFSPSAFGAPASSPSPGQMEQLKANSMVETAKKHLRAMDPVAFEKFIEKNCEIPDGFIRKIPSKFLQYVIKRQALQKKNKESMKKMSAEERRNFAKEQAKKIENYDYEELRKKLMEGKFEDSFVKCVELYEVPFIHGVPAELEQQKMFSHCLEISEFMQLFQDYLITSKTKYCFTAVELYQSLHDKQDGYFIIGQFFKYLLRVLLHENVGKQVQFMGYPLSFFPVGLCSSSEIAKLLFTTKPTCTRETINGNDQNNISSMNAIFKGVIDEEIREAVNKLEQSSLYELDPMSLLKLLQFLIHEVRYLDSFHDYIEESRAVIHTSKEQMKAFDYKIEQLNAKLKEMPPFMTDEEMASLSRIESFEQAKNNKRRAALETELIDLQQRLKEKENHIKIKQRLCKELTRVQPLGYDRFHRRYWYFYNSLNMGIYVEQGWYTEEYHFEYKNSSTDSDDEIDDNMLEKDDLVKMLQRNVEFSAPTPNLPAEWRRISTKEDLNCFLETLNEKGIRESTLRKKILELRDEISLSIDGNNLKQLTPPLIGESLEMKVQILTLYRSLKDNLFLQHIDEPNFEEQLEEANNLEELKEKLVYIVNLTLSTAIKKQQTSDVPFVLTEWLECVKSCPNFSQMMLLFNIFDENIDYSNSMANKRCKVCRKCANPDNPIIKCEKCKVTTHITCTRPRLPELPKDAWTCKRCIKDEEERQRVADWEREEDEYLAREGRSSRGSHSRRGRAIIIDNEDEEEDLYATSEDEDDYFTSERTRRYETRQSNKPVKKSTSLKSRLRSSKN